MTHDLKALSRRWFDEVWNRRNAAAIDQLAAPDVLIYGLSEDGSPARGTNLFREFYHRFLSAFPDIHVIVEDVMQEGDKTAVRLSFSGTHTGQGLAIPPTGRAFRSTANIIIRWRGEQFVEAWNEFDAAGMMRQLQMPAARIKP